MPKHASPSRGVLTCHCYDHVQVSVETSNESKVRILWNQQVQTDRIVTINKSDIIIHDNVTETSVLVEFADPGEREILSLKKPRWS
jgi:hypothetical protein